MKIKNIKTTEFNEYNSVKNQNDLIDIVKNFNESSQWNNLTADDLICLAKDTECDFLASVIAWNMRNYYADDCCLSKNEVVELITDECRVEDA